MQMTVLQVHIDWLCEYQIQADFLETMDNIIASQIRRQEPDCRVLVTR